jgi:fatty acid desaturase
MFYRKHRFSDAIRQQAKPFHRSNNWRGLVAVLEDYAVIALAALAARQWVYLYPLAVLIIGARQRALAALLHDGVHLSLANNRRLNRFLTRWPAGFAIFHSAEYYRNLHIPQHHAHLADPERDPDYVGFIESGLTSLTGRRDFLRHHFFKTVFLGRAIDNVREIVSGRLAFIAKEPRELLQLVIAQVVIALLFGALAGPAGYLWFWIAPFLTVSHVLAWFLEISEHYRLFEAGRSELEITRNRFPLWWEKFFFGLHGETYHLTHHLFPGVPFWNLRALHHVLLQDDAYRRANETRGGLLSAPHGRKTVLSEILEDIDRTNWSQR